MPLAVYTVFPAGKPLEWSPDFAPFEMKHLFEDRERVFALQRYLDQRESGSVRPYFEVTARAKVATLSLADLQKRAEKAVRVYETGVAQARQNDIEAYRRFCARANIPPWPVTDAIRALCIVAKFSAGTYGLRTLWSVLSALARRTGPVFKSVPAYRELVRLKAPPEAAFKTQDVFYLDSDSGKHGDRIPVDSSN